MLATFVQDESCKVFCCLYSSKRKGNARVLLYVFKRTGISADKGLIVCSPSPFTKTTGVSKSIESHFVCRVCDFWTKLFF